MNNAADTMPFAKLMGVTVTEATPERIVGELVVRDDLCTAGGILHGGVIMAFADSLGAIGGFMALPEGSDRHNDDREQDQFSRQREAGVTVRGETTPAHRGRNTSVWQTKIDTTDGEPVALVTQTQMVIWPR